MLLTLRWPAFTLEYDLGTGATVSRFPAGEWSGSAPVAEDSFHGKALGITPERHRFLHELLHHLVGIAFGFGCSPVVWRDAMHFPQAEGKTPTGVQETYLTAEIEEWIVTALTYRACWQLHESRRRNRHGTLLRRRDGG